MSPDELVRVRVLTRLVDAVGVDDEVVDVTQHPQHEAGETEQVNLPVLRPVHEVDREADVDRDSTETEEHHEVVPHLGGRLPLARCVVLGRVELGPRHDEHDQADDQRTRGEDGLLPQGGDDITTILQADRHHQRETEVSREEGLRLALPDRQLVGTVAGEARLEDDPDRDHRVGDAADQYERPPEGGARQNRRQLGHGVHHPEMRRTGTPNGVSGVHYFIISYLTVYCQPPLSVTIG